MSHTYPLADYLTRLRNAQKAKHRWVDIPASNLKREVSVILRREGFIKDFIIVDDDLQGKIRVYPKYTSQGDGVIEGLRCISKPGRRMYRKAGALPRVRNGLGIAIISTSSGILTEKDAKRENVGGEILCYVW